MLATGGIVPAVIAGCTDAGDKTVADDSGDSDDDETVADTDQADDDIEQDVESEDIANYDVQPADSFRYTGYVFARKQEQENSKQNAEEYFVQGTHVEPGSHHNEWVRGKVDDGPQLTFEDDPPAFGTTLWPHIEHTENRIHVGGAQTPAEIFHWIGSDSIWIETGDIPFYSPEQIAHQPTMTQIDEFVDVEKARHQHLGREELRGIEVDVFELYLDLKSNLDGQVDMDDLVPIRIFVDREAGYVMRSEIPWQVYEYGNNGTAFAYVDDSYTIYDFFDHDEIDEIDWTDTTFDPEAIVTLTTAVYTETVDDDSYVDTGQLRIYNESDTLIENHDLETDPAPTFELVTSDAVDLTLEVTDWSDDADDTVTNPVTIDGDTDVDIVLE